MHHRSAQRGSSPARFRNKRVLAVVAALATFGAVAAVAGFANAGTWGNTTNRGGRNCTPAPPAPTATAQAGAKSGTVNGGVQNGRQVWNHNQDGANDRGPQVPLRGRACPTPTSSSGSGTSSGTPTAGPTSTATPPPPPLEILGNNCDNTKFELHDGFQNAPRCVTTEFGEVSEQANNPTLLIVSAPQSVRVGQPFQLRVSTRNLVRDRFLAAGAGGYYKESAFLTAEGLTRGHFHNACRMLSSTRSAPDPNVAPAFFVATEDLGGGKTPDTITIQVTGLPQQGIAQCASWAGDGSHRIPMMTRANEIPAFDSVRIIVR